MLEQLDRIEKRYQEIDREMMKPELSSDPKKLQVFVVCDKATRVKDDDGTEVTVEDEMKTLAKMLGMPYKEIELR